MHLRTLVLVAAAVIAVATCDSSTEPGAPGGTGIAELTKQEARWEEQGLHDYFFEYHYQFGGANEAGRIYVSSDTVAAVTDLATDSTLSLDPRYDWPTVADLFARAKTAISSADANANVNATVDYDPDLGYPTRIDVSPKVNTPGGGSSLRASGLKPLVVLTPQ